MRCGPVAGDSPDVGPAAAPALNSGGGDPSAVSSAITLLDDGGLLDHPNPRPEVDASLC
jgi:hypothetical protein